MGRSIRYRGIGYLLPLLLCIPLLLFGGSGTHMRNPSLFKIGYVIEGVPQYNIADLKIAYRKVVQQYAEGYGVQTDVIYYNHAEDAVRDFRNRKIDSIGGPSGLWARYYDKIRPYGTLFYLVQKSDDTFQRYCLLKRKGVVAQQGSVLLAKGDYNSLLYLRHYTLNHLHRCPNDCFSIEYTKKNSTAIYQLFFKQSDYAIVPEESWKMALEMNPDIAQKVVVVDRSPAVMIYGVTCYANDLSPDLTKKIKESNDKVMHSTTGRNLLILAQVKSQKAIKAETMLPFIDYAKTTKRLMDGACSNKETFADRGSQ